MKKKDRKLLKRIAAALEAKAVAPKVKERCDRSAPSSDGWGQPHPACRMCLWTGYAGGYVCSDR